MSDPSPEPGPEQERTVRDPAAGPTRGRRAVRVSSFAILVVAFLLLAGAAGAAAWGQFKSGKTAPVICMALSAGAVLLTMVALWLRPKR